MDSRTGGAALFPFALRRPLQPRTVATELLMRDEVLRNQHQPLLDVKTGDIRFFIHIPIHDDDGDRQESSWIPALTTFFGAGCEAKSVQRFCK